MEAILVPTDFSPVSKNAAVYAVELAKALNISKIILYNAYQAPVIAEPTMPAVQIMDFDVLKDISTEGLEHFKSSLQHLGDTVDIECVCEFGMLDSSITEVCERTSAGLIVMGISGGNNFEEVIIGSTATSIASHSKVPVIIVPPQAVYSPLQNVVLACDFKKVAETTPVSEIRKLLDATKSKLFVVNINEHKKDEDSEVTAQKQMLDQLLSGYNPEYHFIESEDYVEALNDFAQKHAADLIITIKRKHGMFDRFFKRSHTKHLAFHTSIPLMSIHEEGV